MNMKSAKAYLIYLWLLGFMAIPMALVPPQVMNYLTSLFSRTAAVKLSAVFFVAMLYFLCLCGRQLIDMAQMILGQIYLESRIRKLSLRLYDKILRTSPDFFRNNETPAISNRIINDVRMVEDFFLYFKTSFPVVIIGLLIFSLVLFFGIPERNDYPLIDHFGQQGNWFLATLIILLSPLQAVFLLFDKKIQRIQKESATARDKMASISQETIAGVGVIRSHFAFDFALTRLGEAYKRFNNVQIDMSKLRSIFVGGGPLMNAIGSCILLAVGARLCVGDLYLGGITVNRIGWPDFMGFSGMAVIFHGYVKQMVMFYLEWRITRENIRRVEEYSKAPAIFRKIPDAPTFDGSKAIVAFEDIHFYTKDGIKILNNLNVKVKPGEHIALVGPSGCGKSTALHLMVRDIEPTAGHVRVNNTLLGEYDFSSLARKTGIVFQKPTLFNLSIQENLLLGMRCSTENDTFDQEKDVECHTVGDIDKDDRIRKDIVKVVEDVGLQEDILKKALDNPLPEKYREKSRLIPAIKSLREKIQKRITESNPELICHFNRKQYLFEGTLRENIKFGVLKHDRQDAFIDGAISPGTKSIFRLLKGLPVLESLLHYGHWCFSRDHSIAVRIEKHSSKLFEILKSYQSAGDDAETLGEELGSISDKKLKSIGELKENDQLFLLEIALETNAREAASYFKNDENFKNQIVDSRVKVSHDPSFKTLSIHFFDADTTRKFMSLRENLIQGRVNSEIHGAQDEVDDVIIGLMRKEGFIDELVLMGLEYAVGEGGRFLSGGQSMKVAIARSILKTPSILLMDEVTAPLDEKSQATVMDMIENEFRDKTVFFITHRISTIRNFDRILVFDRGRIAQEGTYDELVSREGLFQTLVRQQEGAMVPAPKMTITDKESQDRQLSGGLSSQSSELQRIIALSPAFSNLTSQHIALLERLTKTVKCTKDTVLFNRGDTGDKLFIIVDGEVEFFIEQATDEGCRVEIVDTYGPGQSFGELALFGDVTRTLGARAKNDLRLCTLSREDLIKLIEVSPQISISLLETLSKRIAQIRDQIY